jgi:hypothetical protein
VRQTLFPLLQPRNPVDGKTLFSPSSSRAFLCTDSPTLLYLPSEYLKFVSNLDAQAWARLKDDAKEQFSGKGTRRQGF